MSDLELADAVARKTGEDAHEIRRRGFVLTGPEDSGLEPECLLDLIDLEEAGFIDWDAVLGDGGFRTPVYKKKAKAKTATSVKKQAARAA